MLMGDERRRIGRREREKSRGRRRVKREGDEKREGLSKLKISNLL
jgi:hypothetical protein